MEELPSLIWFHNDMSPLGGAQREILTTIPILISLAGRQRD